MAQSAPESIAGGIGRRTCREELDSIFLRHRARIRSALILAAPLARWLRGRLGRLAGVLGETAAAVTLGARARGARLAELPDLRLLWPERRVCRRRPLRPRSGGRARRGRVRKAWRVISSPSFPKNQTHLGARSRVNPHRADLLTPLLSEAHKKTAKFRACSGLVFRVLL